MKPNSQWEERFETVLSGGEDVQEIYNYGTTEEPHWEYGGEYGCNYLVERLRDFIAQELQAHAKEQVEKFAEELKEHKEFGYYGTPAEDVEFVAVEIIDTLLRKHTGEEK